MNLSHSLVIAALGLIVCCTKQSTSGEKVATPRAEPASQEKSVADSVPQSAASIIEALQSLHPPLRPTKSGDWLDEHAEPGQTFREYVDGEPFSFEPTGRTIVIQPIGSFSAAQQRILSLTGEAMRLHFGLPVRFEDTIPMSAIPRRARRIHPSWGGEQILTGHVLHQILKPRFPSDAAVFVAVTAVDLWPGRGWNFVFGEALPDDRVGVWSLSRYGDPSRGEKAFRRTLARSIKVGTHETGHLFGFGHCTAHPCNMSGSNNLEETDEQPQGLCPQCLAKVLWLTNQDAVQRYETLATFFAEQGLINEGQFYERSALQLRRRATKKE